MRDTVVCEPVRTPFGRYGGSLRDVTAVDLGVTAVKALLDRTGVDPDRIQDLILGHCNGNAEAPAIGRVVALDSGLPVTTAGQHVDRRCGSGLQSALNAVMAVQSGANDMVIAGGAESMSNASFYSVDMRWGASRTGVAMHDTLARARVTAGGRTYPVPGGMVETAENVRSAYDISRVDQDRLAVMSHLRATEAQRSGVYAEEIAAVTVRLRRSEVVVTDDEHPRADTTLESLAQLKPVMAATIPGATVTAGNSSGQNDGAAVCLVTTSDLAESHGLRPLVRLVSWSVAGVPPAMMGIGPVPATEAALGRAGLSLADLDVIELNEAFAAQALAVLREWGCGDADLDRINPHGSGISLGHPVGATGTRMLGTLARELHRRNGRYGLTTMCIGGGQGLAAVWERVS